MGTVAWELWLGNFSLGTLTENFSLGTLAWELWLGISGWGCEAWGTGLLRIAGEPPEDCGGTRLSGDRQLVLKNFSKNPLGKPSEGKSKLEQSHIPDNPQSVQPVPALVLAPIKLIARDQNNR